MNELLLGTIIVRKYGEGEEGRLRSLAGCESLKRTGATQMDHALSYYDTHPPQDRGSGPAGANKDFLIHVR
jgi:hypothetical protein